MGRNSTDEAEFRRIAEELEIDVDDVRKAVNSFFEVFINDAKSLPFDNLRKIYSRQVFSSVVSIRNIPFIGRLGPSYTRYLRWRANEASSVPMKARSSYRSRYLQSEIESTAAAILSGGTPSLPQKQKFSKMYNRVWLVGQDGKKSARQVIPKEDK